MDLNVAYFSCVVTIGRVASITRLPSGMATICSICHAYLCTRVNTCEHGAILFSFASGGSVIDAPSIVNGTVYWGSGYRNIAPGIGNNKVYAFTLHNKGGK
jgi:hypothetical protein